MQNLHAKTVTEYLGALSPDQRKAIVKVRGVVRKHLPRGYKEGVTWGMITYGIPLSRYPDTYNGQPLCYAALAAHKNFLTLYLMNAYTGAVALQRLKAGFSKAGKKLDMGKSCVHFRTADDLPLDVIADVVALTPADEFIASYEKSRARTNARRTGATGKAATEGKSGKAGQAGKRGKTGKSGKMGTVAKTIAK